VPSGVARNETHRLRTAPHSRRPRRSQSGRDVITSRQDIRRIDSSSDRDLGSHRRKRRRDLLVLIGFGFIRVLLATGLSTTDSSTLDRARADRGGGSVAAPVNDPDREHVEDR